MADVGERVGKLQLASSDRRLAVAAELIVGGGEVLGKAVVLSQNTAVTTSRVANSAQGRVAIADRVSPANPEVAFGPLGLVFPQFRSSPGILRLDAMIEAIDDSLRFAVLGFSGQLPSPVPSNLLGTGELPPDGADCCVVYADDPQTAFFQISGQMENRLGEPMFYLYLRDLPADQSQLMGAPVFFESRLIGIVVGGPFRSVSRAFTVGVLSVREMALSKVTPAIRSLLPWIEDDSGGSHTPKAQQESPVLASEAKAEASSSFSGSAAPTGGVIAQGNRPISVTGSVVVEGRSSDSSASDRTPAGTVPQGFSADDFGRLSPSGRSALGRADRMRRVGGLDKVHMEHLIAALYAKQDGPAQRLFRLAKIDGPRLLQVIRETVGTIIPEDHEAPAITGLPPVSAHVREALTAAMSVVGATGPIRTRDLLYGVLSVGNCRLVEALIELGVRKEDVVRYDPPPLAEEPIEPREDLAGSPERERNTLSANPTPKVASDLWCREDRLGYEAYARTIAELITHEETVAPLTIGIKAPWGAGKTSLMKRVQELLDGGATVNEAGRAKILEDSHPQLTLRDMLARLKDSTKPMGLKLKRGKDYNFPPRITVWFNAWKYQTSEQVWAGMAHCIINQVTARMSIRDRELFWLRLHARRVNADEVRKKVYESVARQLWPIALVVFVGCVAVIWMASGVHDVSIQRFIQGGAIFASLAGMIWKAWDKLGDKAAETVKEMVREPGYEGKMGYLHLVESDMRDVLELVTEAQQPPEEATSGAKAPAGKKDSIAALEALRHPKSASPAKGPLVVFVDDLDRCAPNKVADVVEAINLFLCGDYPNCIFVLGMEPGMVAAALEVANKDVIEKAEEMGLTDQSVPVGWRFMEKIIQLPIMIPPPTKGGRDSYVQSLTGVNEFNAYMAKMVENVPQQEFQSQIGWKMPGPAEFERLRAAAQEPAKEEDVAQFQSELTGLSLSEVVEKSNKVLAEVPLEKRRAAAEASKRAYAEAFVERDPLMGKFVTDVAQLVDGNPRQIKRYVNVFRSYSTLRHSLQVDGVATREELPSDEMMAKFVALSVHWPHAMDCLRKKDAKASEANGRKVTLLESLESESRKTPAEVATVDAAWEKFVGKEGLGLGAWAMRPAFREFLSRGESLFQNEGHGLW